MMSEWLVVQDMQKGDLEEEAGVGNDVDGVMPARRGRRM